MQNNGYAISVPLAKQTHAPALAYKGVGYGVRSEWVDGNDPVAVLAVLAAAVEHGRAGNGPFLIEALTYRMDAHTNADDAAGTATPPKSTNGTPATRSPASGPTCAPSEVLDDALGQRVRGRGRGLRRRSA